MSDLIKAADNLERVIRPLICDSLSEAESHEDYVRKNGNHHELDQAESDLNLWRDAQAALTAYRNAREQAGEME